MDTSDWMALLNTAWTLYQMYKEWRAQSGKPKRSKPKRNRRKGKKR